MNWNEAELFTLFWTQYLGEAIEPKCLEDLWHRRRASGEPGGAGHLPYVELVTQGFLGWKKMGKRTGIAFKRESVSVDELRTVLSAADDHDWRFSLKDFSRWAETALYFENHYGRSWECDSRMSACFSRHVLYRYGLTAWRRAIARDYRRLNPESEYVGADKAVARELKRKCPFPTSQRYYHCGPSTYVEIDAWPDGLEPTLKAAYEDRRKDQWTYREVESLCTVAREESRSLRAGATVFDPQTEAELVAFVAAEDFLHGASTGWAVERLNALRRTTPLTPWCTLLLQALAFWRGDLDTIRDVDATSPFCVGHKRRVARALLNAAAGDFEASAKELASAMGIAAFPQNDYWRFYDLPALLVLLVCKLKSPTQPAPGLKKLSRILEETPVGYETLPRYDKPGELRANVRWAIELVNHSLAEANSRSQPSAPTLLPFAYLRTLLSTYDAGRYPLDTTAAADWTRQALHNGYPGMAADLAAMIRLLSDETADAKTARATVEALGTDPAAAFAAPKAVREHWENALDNLAKVLGADAPKGRRRQDASTTSESPRGKFSWGVSIDTETPGFVNRVFAVLEQPRKSGGYSSPKPVKDRAFLEGKIDDLLSPEDLEIKSLLVGGGCIRADRYSDRLPPSLAVLRKLAERPNLLCCKDALDGYWDEIDEDEPLSPLLLKTDKAALRISMTTDGGAEISVPIPWDRLPERRPYALQRDAREKSLWRILEISKEYRNVARAMARETQGSGVLRIPLAGLERLEQLYSDVSGKAPVAWARSGVDVRRDIPREPTTPVPCVRVSFADGALSAALVVRLLDEPLWTSEPGKGLPERLIVRKDATKVMRVRDFSAEETAVAPARAALAPFDESKADETHWYFSGLGDSLNALSALHAAAADGTFELEWPEGETLKLSQLVSQSARYEGGETADYWLGVSGEFKLDDGKVLSFVELLRAFDAREGAYVRLTEGRYLKLTAALARRVEALKGAGIERGGKLLISPAAIPSLEKIARETEADDTLPLPEIVRTRLETIREAFAKPQPTPQDFKCQMRPYQAEGYEWLSRLASCGIGACLADDMGLGKTIQLIALLLARRKAGVSLVIAPASVAFNWRNEIERFAPSLRTALVGQIANAGVEDVAALSKENDVIITSYGVLTTREDQFSPLDWNVIVLDEAQAIKNHLTKRAKSVKTLKAKFRVVATGTPIENRLSELWSLFDFINPGMLGGEARFARELAPHGEPTPRLKRLVQPLILRRIKRDVLTDLPEKEEITVPVVLGDEERHAYEATRRNAVARLEAEDPSDKLAILAELTRLRRFCCHPSLVMPSVMVSAKLEALEELLENLRSNDHRALVFSQFVDYLAIVRDLLNRKGWSYKYLDGSTSKTERERSVTSFQSGEGDFFLISLKAGGMGLNLTAANYVILLDPWWNPAVENQAADRVHRIGQRLPVTVYRLIAQDTIEEKVVKLHAKKNALAEDVLASGASSLSAEAMFSLLADG